MYKYYKKPRDTKSIRLILEQYVKYGYVQSNFLAERVEGKIGKHYLVRLQRNLSRNMGILERPTKQKDLHHDVSSFYTYFLNEKGDELVKHFGIDIPIVCDYKRPKIDPDKGIYELSDVEDFEYWHNAGISNTVMSYETGCKNHGLEFISQGEINERYKSIHGEDMDMNLPFSTFFNGKVFEGARKADFLFGIRYPDTSQTSFFIGEYERTSPVKNPDLSRKGRSWQGKVLAYVKILSEKPYQKQWGIPNLSLIVLTNKEQKTTDQIKLTKELIGDNGKILFDVIPDESKDKVAPAPYPEILTRPMQRAGYCDRAIYCAHKDKLENDDGELRCLNCKKILAIEA